MKRHLSLANLAAIVLAVITLLLHYPSTSAADQTVTVWVYENAPKIFTAESGKPAGIFIDIIEAIARTEGWTLRYVHGTWGEGLSRLEKGEIDLMPDVAYMAERERIFSFHRIPVLSGWSQVYARKGSGIQSILDLNGKRVVALEQTIQLETFRRLANSFELKIALIPVPDYKTGFRMIADGRADAGVTNRFYGLMNGRKFGLEDTPIMFDPAQFFFAAPKDRNQPLLDAIDRDLAALKKDPRSAYYRSMGRWTSEEVQFKLPVWLEVLGLVLGVALIASLVGAVVLKSQVKARTRELQTINETLDQKVRERTVELEHKNLELAAANEKLKELDQLKSMFIASMSHELRTPLNSIIGFTGILLQGLAGPLNDEQRKQLGMVKGSSQHLLALITDIIDLSKIEAGKISLTIEPFDLAATTRAIVDTFRVAADRKALVVTVSGPERLMVESDVRRVKQVLVNLVGNAVKFTESGEVRVEITAGSDRALVAVHDSGPGIRAEDLGKLFRYFSQVTSADLPKHEGTGLGLYISRKLMNLLGGEIDVASEFGRGSTFTVSMPLNGQEMA